MTELSVLIPTTGKRPEMLFKVKAAIVTQLPFAEILTVEGFSWGEGLNLLAMTAKGKYLSCCCDDTVPVAGWFEAGRAMLDTHVMPASRYFEVNGQPTHEVDEAPHGLEIGWCRSFLLTPEMFREVGPFIDATWYADWDYSERLTAVGWPIQACDGYAFTHLNGERDWNTQAEDARQRAAYEDSHRRQGIEA